jgi:putative acetyltransferase
MTQILDMKKNIQKKDILIRHAELDDLPAIHEIYSCPKAFSGTLQLPYPSLELWRKRLSNIPDGTYYLVAIVDRKVVGHLGLYTFPNTPRRKHAGTFGMGVHDDWQGKGIGTALLKACVDMADNWLNLKRLELEVYTDNEAAIRLYERFGFVHEGTLRQHAFRDGKYVDSYLMARFHSCEDVS